MMLLLKVLLVIVLLAVTNVNCLHEIAVTKSTVVSNSDYPSFSTKPDNWALRNSKVGGAVLVECNIKFKGSNPNCATASLEISDGVRTDEICTNRTNYRMHSKFTSISIDLRINGGALQFNCNSTPMDYGRPDKDDYNNSEDIQSKPTKTLPTVNEDIVVTKDSINRIINGNFTSNMNYKYTFRSAKDEHIKLRCEMRVHVTPPTKPSCNGFKFFLQVGGKKRWICGEKNAIAHLGQSDKLDVIITSGPNKVVGDIECEVKAINQIKYSNYKQIASEEVDSSEHGLKQITGTKETTCACGWANKSPARVIFGKDTGKHEFPWSVSLQYKSSKFHFCGGSIITPYHVITASHCIGSKKAEHILVVMGTYNRTDNRISSEVKAIFEHDYSRKTHINDIAILELSKKVEYTQFVGPVCLPKRDPQIVRQYITAMGWGRLHKTEQGIKDQNIMKKTKLRVVDIASCSIDWNYHWDVESPKVICTWSNHTDICIGDSGGPVVWLDPETNRYTLVGLPALCDSCTLRMPSAHTAVHVFYDWIQDIIKKSSQPEASTCSKKD
uniref:Venom s1 protease 9 n=1 Tax=Pristhesancus plagipennis TaxID=1955184 RepID=A0A1Q1NPH2_PRIPG|nr:venom s1 protease 9 [Pristhesancus plagipennis]